MGFCEFGLLILWLRFREFGLSISRFGDEGKAGNNRKWICVGLLSEGLLGGEYGTLMFGDPNFQIDYVS